MKTTTTNNRWKKRLFVIHENTLFYFAAETDKEPKGIIVLKDTTVEICNPQNTLISGKKPPPETTSANTQTSDYYSLVVKTPFRSFWLLNTELKVVQSWASYITALNDSSNSNTSNNGRCLFIHW